MKHLIVFCCLITTANSLFGQTNFNIISNGSTYTSEMINTAFSTADFCGMQFQSKRNSIQFDDGTVVEILSAQELGNISGTCVLEDETVLVSCKYSISNNVIMKKYEYEPSDQQKKIQTIKK